MKRMIRAAETDITFEDLAKAVSDSFIETMDENDFETFTDMKETYWWTLDDIKDEIDYIIRTATDEKAYIDELDRSDVFIGGQDMKYRAFAAMWQGNLKKAGRY